MRGAFEDQGGLFSYISPEARVPKDHPLRQVRALVREVLSELNRSLGRLYSSEGRPSIPPEQLLSALLLQAFYGIRSERQLMEQLDYNLLYRWFVGLSPDDPVWDPTTFTKNRSRLENGEVFSKFMARLLNHPQVKPLLSDEHFSVDGTLIEAWASQKSFRPKDGSGDEDGGANFHGQKRKNDTHASITDPDSRLYRKAAGREAKLCYMGHVTMENRHGLAVAGRGAAIAFYAATSLAPVLLIVVAIAGLVFGQDAARGAISQELGQLLGPTGGDFIKSILERSSDPGSGTTIIGVVTILITASGVFGEMHMALNATFKAKPIDEPISALIRTRAASLGLVAALGFMLVVSLAASAGLSALGV